MALVVLYVSLIYDCYDLSKRCSVINDAVVSSVGFSFLEFV